MQLRKTGKIEFIQSEFSIYFQLHLKASATVAISISTMFDILHCFSKISSKKMLPTVDKVWRSSANLYLILKHR